MGITPLLFIPQNNFVNNIYYSQNYVTLNLSTGYTFVLLLHFTMARKEIGLADLSSY